MRRRGIGGEVVGVVQGRGEVTNCGSNGGDGEKWGTGIRSVGESVGLGGSFEGG